MEKLINKFEEYIIYAVVFLTPVFFTSAFTNPFTVPKLTILFWGLGLVIVLKSVKVLFSGKLNFQTGDYDLPIFIFILSYLVSGLFRTPNKMEAFLFPGFASVAIVTSCYYFVLNQLPTREKTKASYALIAAATVFAVLSILAQLGILAKVPQLPPYVKNTLFNPEGGVLPGAIFLFTLVPIIISGFIVNKNWQSKTLLGIAGIIVLGSLVLNIYYLLPGKPASPRFPSLSTSWIISVEALKENPILGVGPGNYVTAFNRFRPLAYNQTDLWAVKFSTATNFFLTNLTETGLLGLAALVLLVVAIYKNAKKDIKEKALVKWGFPGYANLISGSLLILAVLLFPATTIILFSLFIVLALMSKTHSARFNLHFETVEHTDQQLALYLPSLILVLPIIAVVGYLLFRSVNIISAEHIYRKSIDALAQNKANDTYELMRTAISKNPKVDRYHFTFSRLNLLLANAVATKKELNDKDKQDISTFVQQAINEAKSAVILNSTRAGNWELLGSTYQSIIPLAKGADDFAIQSYRQAIILDPLNPNLRIAFGGLYFGKKQYTDSARIFELAVATKPDHANAHYNLAFAYQNDNQIDKAIEQMTLVLSLIDKGSKDYEVASKALADMQAKKQEVSAASGDQLTPPKEAQEPILKPPLDLPEESEPPADVLTPTPTPTLSEELSPTPTVIP